MRIGGWKTDSAFRRYNIVDERDLQEAADALDQKPPPLPHTERKPDRTRKTANHCSAITCLCWQRECTPLSQRIPDPRREWQAVPATIVRLGEQFCRRRLSSGLGQHPVWLALEGRQNHHARRMELGLESIWPRFSPGRLRFARCLCPLPTREPRFAIRSSFSQSWSPALDPDRFPDSSDTQPTALRLKLPDLSQA